MTVLYLSEEHVRELASMPLAITAMEAAFCSLAAGRASNVPRARAQGRGMVLHSMSAMADYLGLAGWKQYTTTKRGANFLVGLHDAESGALVALIEANRLGQLRTGAVTGLAARMLADPGTREIGILGAGYQAETQLAAVAAVLPLRRAHVYCRGEPRRREFAERMSRELQFEVVPAPNAKSAVENFPLVVTATSSREPVLAGEWLASGTLLCAIGSNWLNKAELDVTAITRADTIVCDSIAACQIEAGDFTEAISKGLFDWSGVVEFAHVVVGKKPAQKKGSGIVIFKSVGLAIEDVALGGKVLELAREQNVGVVLPIVDPQRV